MENTNITSFENDEIKQVYWESKVPIIINLNRDDINSNDEPPRLIFNIERNGYLANYIKEILVLFEKYLPIGFKDGDIWLSLDGIPVKWNLPFGVIVDSIVKNQEELPIYFKCHLRNFPEASLVKYKKDGLRFFYLNSLKEACTTTNGNAKDIFNLSTRDTEKLLESLSTNYKLYKEIVEKIQISNKFPVKFVFSKTDIVLNKVFYFNEKETDFDLKHFILTAFDKQTCEMIFLSKILISGIQFDLSTPMIFICSNFRCCDLFLYIVIYS